MLIDKRLRRFPRYHLHDYIHPRMYSADNYPLGKRILKVAWNARILRRRSRFSAIFRLLREMMGTRFHECLIISYSLLGVAICNIFAGHQRMNRLAANLPISYFYCRHRVGQLTWCSLHLHAVCHFPVLRFLEAAPSSSISDAYWYDRNDHVKLVTTFTMTTWYRMKRRLACFSIWRPIACLALWRNNSLPKL